MYENYNNNHNFHLLSAYIARSYIQIYRGAEEASGRLGNWAKCTKLGLDQRDLAAPPAASLNVSGSGRG